MRRPTTPSTRPTTALVRGFTLTLAAAALLALPAAAQDSVAGDWIFTVDSPDGAGTMEVPFSFEQDGEEVTGTVDLSVVPQVTSASITEGELVDGILFFVLEVSAEGQYLAVEVEAEVTGDEMVGEVYMVEMGQFSPFTGKRQDGGD